MELLNATVLSKGWKKHPATRTWLENWQAVVLQAEWQSLEDVRKSYPSADGVKVASQLVVTIFNVKGNQFRLLTEVRYAQEQVVVLQLLTHAEYDKQKWK